MFSMCLTLTVSRKIICRLCIADGAVIESFSGEWFIFLFFFLIFSSNFQMFSSFFYLTDGGRNDAALWRTFVTPQSHSSAPCHWRTQLVSSSSLEQEWSCRSKHLSSSIAKLWRRRRWCQREEYVVHNVGLTLCSQQIPLENVVLTL